MNRLKVVIEGRTFTPGGQAWVRHELQKLVDRHAPFIGLDLKVAVAESFPEGVPAMGDLKKCPVCGDGYLGPYDTCSRYECIEQWKSGTAESCIEEDAAIRAAGEEYRERSGIQLSRTP